MENIPVWGDVLYYLFLIITLLGVIFSLFRKRFIIPSLCALFMLLTVPVLSMLVALESWEEFNEFEWIAHEALHGSPAAIYCVAGFLYLLFWWGLMLKTGIKWTRTRIIILCIAGALLVSAYPLTYWIDQLTRAPYSIEKYSFIYSHPFEGTSYFMTTNDGRHITTGRVDAGDIVSMQVNRAKPNSIYLLSTHENAFYALDAHKAHVIRNRTPEPLTFLVNSPQLTILSYNKGITNVLHVADQNWEKKYDLTFTGYLETAIYTDQFIYVLNNSTSKEQCTLIAIKRETGKISKRITLTGNASSLISYNHALVIDTQHKLTVVFPEKQYQVKRVDYLTSPDAPENSLYVFRHHLYATYEDQNGQFHIWKLDSHFHTVSDQVIALPETGIPAAIKFAHGKLCLLIQYNGDEKGSEGHYGGKFFVYDVDTFRQELRFFIPKHKVKVQDFIVR